MRICFWGNVASALSGNTPGGGELQIALIAKVLANKGHDVNIVDYTIESGYTTSDGIKIYPVQDWNKGFRIVRTITHRLPGLYKTLVSIEADIYYCRIREFRHIIAYWAARKVKAKFVIGLAHDLEILSFADRCKYEYFTNIGNLWWFSNMVLSELLFPKLLRWSDLVLSQHAGQKDILMKKGIQSIVFPNLIDLDEIPMLTNPARKQFVYAGSIAKNKGVIELFHIIESTPDFYYNIIGQPRDKTGRKYYEKLKSMPNVRLMGRMNHPDTLLQIMNSKALICTSPMEGFPNIFIEAWVCETPVISLYVNPGDIFSNSSLGKFSYGSIEVFIHQMQRISEMSNFMHSAKLLAERTYGIGEYRNKEIERVFKSVLNN